MTDLKVEMQNRCPQCDTEIWTPAVYEFSQGGIACPTCGVVSKKMDTGEYRKALSETRRRMADERGKRGEEGGERNSHT